MRGVEIDAEARRGYGPAPATPGTTSSRRPPSTAWRRCTAPPPRVGIVGYTIGGGVGWYSRRRRPRLQPGHRVRRGRAPMARRAGSTPTATPTCSGRCAAAAAASPSSPALEFELLEIARGLRRGALLPLRAGRRGPARLARVDRRRAGGDDLARAADAVPADRGRPGAGPRQILRDRSRRSTAATRRPGAELTAPLRDARPGDGQPRRGAAGRHRRPAHGPARPGPRLTGHLLLATCRRQAIDDLLAAAGPGSGLDPDLGRGPPRRRRPLAAARGRRRARHSARRLQHVRRRLDHGPRRGRPDPRAPRRAALRHGPLRGGPLPQLLRGADRVRDRLLRRDLRAPARGEGASTTRTASSRPTTRLV